ncbi:helix-turn-helix domain-containing protein [Rhizobium sp. PAMB 3182]
MIMPSQLRAARAMLALSEDDLAALSGVEVATIRAIESETANYDDGLFQCLGRALESRGIVFLSGDDGGPGVRLKSLNAQDDGIRPENLNSANDG